MPKLKQHTWLDYIRSCCMNTSLTPNTKKEFLDLIVSLNRDFLALFYHTIPLVYLLDYTSGKYLTMSNSAEHILGFPQKEFIENGVNFTLDNYEKVHLDLFDKQIFPDRLNVLKKIPPEEHSNYLFTHSFCLKNNKNEPVNLLQRNIFIRSDEKGNPLMSAGLVVNIDHYQKGKPVLQTVEKIEKDLKDGPQMIFKKAYYFDEEDRLFSKREKEILKWMAEGLTSKEIGAKFFISEGTVINHRKNMLYKTNTPNVAALIAFAFRNGII